MVAKFPFPAALKEVRFLFCQTGEGSAAVRSFLLNSYPAMKTQNPTIPILLREAVGTQPTLVARFEKGQETTRSLQGLSDKEIEITVTGVTSQA